MGLPSQSNTVEQMVPNIPRKGITRNASYNLKDVHGGGAHGLNGLNGNSREDFEITGADGQIVRIKNSGIVHTLSHKTCLPTSANLGLVATLFYNPAKKPVNPDADPHEIPCEDVHFGTYVSDMAVFEFVQTIDNIIVPWKKGNGTTHRCLDTTPVPRVMEIMISRPENLQISDLCRHEDLHEFEKKWNICVVLQEHCVFRRYKCLAVFDMDSTLIQQEVIDEIARYVGVEDEVSVSFSSGRIPRLSDEMDDGDPG